jgi:hypothetical protein
MSSNRTCFEQQKNGTGELKGILHAALGGSQLERRLFGFIAFEFRHLLLQHHRFEKQLIGPHALRSVRQRTIVPLYTLATWFERTPKLSYAYQIRQYTNHCATGVRHL